MKELYSKLDMIAKTAKRGFITLSEANHEMEKEIDRYFITHYNYENKIKAYRKMYKILFDLSKIFIDNTFINSIQRGF